MNNLKSFSEELKKLAAGSYKCSSCGYDPGGNEEDQMPKCPKCGAGMRDGPGYETRVNS